MMNHIKPNEVKVTCPEARAWFVAPFKELVKQKYSEEDLNNKGELCLSVPDFQRFFHNYLEEIKK
jgi:hypothetical protein